MKDMTHVDIKMHMRHRSCPPTNNMGYFFTKPDISSSGQLKSDVITECMLKNIEKENPEINGPALTFQVIAKLHVTICHVPCRHHFTLL
jgi:hypothetical protein